MTASPSPERSPAKDSHTRSKSKSPPPSASADPPEPETHTSESDVDSQQEDGEVDEDAPPEEPPLPQEAPPAQDDGWDCQFDPSTQAWFFYNRFTGKTQWDNPRVPSEKPAASAPAPQSEPPVSGYNPAIHGDYDPNAWYAQKYNQTDEPAPLQAQVPSLEDGYTSTAGFNRFTGQFQQEDAGPGRHTDDAKSRRQMNAFFDVDAAANADDGRSLKAERAGKRISKSELKAFKEKRRARKEEKRRAWLRD